MSELLEALPDDIETAAKRVLKAAKARDWSIVTAESCTGGLVASLLTDVEGLSGQFERGFVVYSKEAKCELLAVERGLIDSCGAVSERTARAMALGALDRSHADVSVAITGFAGPGGPDDEPGLVHFGAARRDGEVRTREEHFGDIGRGPTRLQCLRVALEMLEAALTDRD